MSAKRLHPLYPRSLAITAKIPPNIFKEVDALAAAANQSRSEYVRMIISSHLESNKTA